MRGGWEACSSLYQIEEAADVDRFLLAVAEHPKVREKNYFFFAAAFFAGAFLPAFAAFFLATVALLTEPTGETCRTRLANRAEASSTNHHRDVRPTNRDRSW